MALFFILLCWGFTPPGRTALSIVYDSPVGKNPAGNCDPQSWDGFRDRMTGAQEEETGLGSPLQSARPSWEGDMESDKWPTTTFSLIWLKSSTSVPIQNLQICALPWNSSHPNSLPPPKNCHGCTACCVV